jgi:biopolymer transport protein TolR
MLRSRSSSLKPISKIDVTAFSSVMALVVLTLLIIEMVAFPMALPRHGISIHLPRVNHPTDEWQATREDAMIVAILRDGKIFFGNNRVEPEQLSARIKEQLGQHGERKVYIKADARVPYRRVSRVLDAVRSAGVLRIAFLVEQRRTLLPQ